MRVVAFLILRAWEYMHVMSSQISNTDNLCDEPDGECIAIAMSYCDLRSQQELTADIMGASLRQLVARGVLGDEN